MQVVEVIPVVKGITKSTLTYFTKDKFEPGSFVRVPVRSGTALGIVVKSFPARQAKAELKEATYSLKKLARIDKAGRLSPAFMRAAEKTADYYAATLGSVLSALLPKIFLESPELLGKADLEERTFREVKLVQLPEVERLREYKGIIREAFARKTSVTFVTPTREDAVRALETLSNGIENYVHSAVGRKPKEIKAILWKAHKEKHPIVFITTPAFLAFDRPDLETIIVDRENSRSYRTLSRPHIHLKTFLEYYARESGKTLIFGDSVLSLETLWKERGGTYSEAAPLTWRIKYTAPSKLVDMRKRKFEVMSPELKDMLTRAIQENKRVFLFGARKGLAPSTVCGDCGSLLLCDNCQAPLVLHETHDKSKPNEGESRLYICHHCGARRSAATRCDTCNSWKLNALGVGIDRIVAEVEALFPSVPVLVLDKDHAETATRARVIAKRFESEGGVLVGTELAFLHLTSVSYAAVVSLDALFSVPDFSMNERIFYLVTRLRQLTAESFLVQTRNVGEEILSLAADGNILDFYRAEIKEREELLYPPFSIFVKVSTLGTREALEKKAVYLQSLFKDHKPHFIVENRGTPSGKRMLNMVLRIPRESWPVSEIKDKLLLLSPEFLIKVDPESIL
ncbi:hypothetical protein KW785_00660 [Candidatus Parcubacteria bacterium]|nr:hypothetical protein [Candidatus Parcubacteria bacterium]